MKTPVSPPEFEQLYENILETGAEVFLHLVQSSSPVDQKGRYLHWDKVRHLAAPENMTIEQWWLSLKSARRNLYQSVPLQDKQNKFFQYSTTAHILNELHWLDRHAAGSIKSSNAITNIQTRNTYLVSSLIEEAINSSQLEGASTTRDVAKEMIRQNRNPKDKSEQMILNNYIAMQFIHQYKNEKLTPSIVNELHEILTRGTMDESAVGRFRTQTDDIHVIDRATQQYLHTPPAAGQLKNRMQQLCAFANSDVTDQQTTGSSNTFLHPVVKAITLHFMLAYDHPYCDGNGRTARALFYWSMANQGYWLTEFVSISRIIKQSPAQYGRAFLYTETDDNDLTYFLVHQLDVIRKSVDDLQLFLAEKLQAISEAEKLLVLNPRLNGKLNFRQLALLRHALKHPRFSYIVEEHQRSHGISYDVARKDLLQMADSLKLLLKTKQGKRYFFVVPNDLEDRIAAK